MLVVVRLSGGLGNQLFQYAAGRALSVKHNVPLYIEKSFYAESPNRHYKLNSFNTCESVISKRELVATLLKRKFKLSDYFKSVKSICLESNFLFSENSFSYNPDFLSIDVPVVLNGYWQSEKYFEEFFSWIKNDFKVIDNSGLLNAIFIDKISTENSVAIHVRRGDYLSNKQINSIHGICSDEYYVTAYKELVEKVGEVTPYFFTDDTEDARRIIKLIGKGVLINDVCPGSDVSDFLLMTSCRHFIVANSTFSWWAAYLGSSPSKMVFAPLNWFKSTDYNTIDLIPLNWIKI